MATKYIQENDTIFLDAGTSISAMIQYLPINFHYNLVTCALHTAIEASQLNNAHVHIVGGTIRSALQEVVGPKAVSEIKTTTSKLHISVLAELIRVILVKIMFFQPI